VVATARNPSQIAQARNPRNQAKTVAVGCDQLPKEFHGKQGVCRGLPPVAGGPLPAKEGVDAYLARLCAPIFFVQSGHGHWSQPQPVHAWRIMAR
jgi:hypothetical protein